MNLATGPLPERSLLRRFRVLLALAVLAGTSPAMPAGAWSAAQPPGPRGDDERGPRTETASDSALSSDFGSSSHSSDSGGGSHSSDSGGGSHSSDSGSYSSDSGSSSHSSDSGSSSHSSDSGRSARGTDSDRSSRSTDSGRTTRSNPTVDSPDRSGPRLDQSDTPASNSYGGRRSYRDSNHGSHGGSHHHPSYHPHHDYPYSSSWWWWDWSFGYSPYWRSGPFYGPSVYWSVGDGYWSVGGAYRPSVPYYTYARDDLGALDLNVRPRDAAVYVNGQYVGVANNFDGFPSYLWLEPGTYHLVLFLEGYETVSREYTLHRSLVIDVKERLREGVATAVQDIPVPPRVRYQQEQQQAEQEARSEREEEWRQRAREYKERRQEATAAPAGPGPWAPEARADTEASAGTGAASRDVRQAPATLRLRVIPADASVYLDGRLIGSAAELLDLRDGLLLDPGEHVLDVVRPGHTPEQRTFTVRSGDMLELNVELTAPAP